MSSPQGAVRSKTPFPFVGLAVAVLLVHAILVALLPENPYRAAIALVALLAVGYCALVLVAGRDLELSALEILAFSVVLTILITALSAIGVSLLGIPITVFAVVIVGLPMALLAWILRRPRLRSLLAIGDFARGLFDFSDYSKVEKGAATVLLVAIAASLGVLLSLSAVNFPDTLSPGIAITGPDGKTGSLPYRVTVGQAQAIIVSAFGGSTGGPFVVRIRLVPQNATGNETFHAVAPTSPLMMDAFAQYNTSIVLASRGVWNQTFSIAIDVAGNLDLRFELLDQTSAIVATNRLPLIAS